MQTCDLILYRFRFVFNMYDDLDIRELHKLIEDYYILINTVKFSFNLLSYLSD